MAGIYSYYGCGVRLISLVGHRKGRESYLATQWITLFYLPLIPMRSYMVRYHGRRTGFFETVQNVEMLKAIPLSRSWQHVVLTLLVFYVGLPLATLAILYLLVGVLLPYLAKGQL